jgi:hypothetical protein
MSYVTFFTQCCVNHEIKKLNYDVVLITISNCIQVINVHEGDVSKVFTICSGQSYRKKIAQQKAM